MTRTDSEVADPGTEPDVEAILAPLHERVPGLPDDLHHKVNRDLRDLLTHSQLQAVFYACQQLAPDVTREALAEATILDLVSWIESARGTERPAAIPRGSYRTKNVHLRPLEERDIQALYRASLEPRNAHRWWFRGRTPSPEEFRASIYRPGLLAQLVVEHTESGTAVGTVYAFNADPTSRHCYIAVQRMSSPPGNPAKGLMVEGFFVFVQYVFDHFGCDKVYLEIPGYNRSLVQGGADSMLELEGLLKEHHYYGDKLWDQWIYALYKERWEEFAPFFRSEWPDA